VAPDMEEGAGARGVLIEVEVPGESKDVCCGVLGA